MISFPMKNGYFIGNINPTFSDIGHTNPNLAEMEAAEGSADGGLRALPLCGVLCGCAAAAVPSRVLRVGHGDRGRMFQAWMCCVTNVEM